MAYGDGDWIRDLDSEVTRLRAQVTRLRLEIRIAGGALDQIRGMKHNHKGEVTIGSSGRCAVCAAVRAHVLVTNEIIRHSLRARRAEARKAAAQAER